MFYSVHKHFIRKLSEGLEHASGTQRRLNLMGIATISEDAFIHKNVRKDRNGKYIYLICDFNFWWTICGGGGVIL